MFVLLHLPHYQVSSCSTIVSSTHITVNTQKHTMVCQYTAYTPLYPAQFSEVIASTYENELAPNVGLVQPGTKNVKPVHFTPLLIILYTVLPEYDSTLR